MQNRLIRNTFIGLLALCFSGFANAHTTAIGWVNSGPSTVTFWFKSWHGYSAPFFEGSFNLVGVNGNPYPDTTVAFDQTFDGSGNVTPDGLVDGVNLFYACSSSGLCDTDEDGNGGSKWQGVTFTNLLPGDYDFGYIPAASPSADWAPANASISGVGSSITLSSAIVGGEPEVVPTLPWGALLLLCLLAAWIGLRHLPANSRL